MNKSAIWFFRIILLVALALTACAPTSEPASPPAEPTAQAAAPASSDTMPPDIMDFTAPAEGSILSSDSFNVVATLRDEVSTYPYLQISGRLDSGAWSEWTADSTLHYEKLSNGFHFLEVKARDEAGNESRPLERSFNVMANQVMLPPNCIIQFNDPITGQVENRQWFFWDGKNLRFGKTILAMTADFQLAASAANTSQWGFPDEGKSVIVVSLGTALPGAQLNGVIYVLGCEKQTFISFTPGPIQIGPNGPSRAP